MKRKFRRLACLSFVLFIVPIVLTQGNIRQDDFSRFQSLFRNAQDHYEKGRFDLAAKAFLKGWEILRKTDVGGMRAETCRQLAMVYWNLGQMAESEAFFRKASVYAAAESRGDLKRITDEILRIYPLYEEGKKARREGKTERSVESFRKAVEIARAVRSEAHELKILRQMSITYWESSDLEMFFRLNRKALELAQGINHLGEQGRCTNNIGLYYWKRNDYTKALTAYHRALSIARTLDDKTEISSCVNNIGLIYKDFNCFEQARFFLEEALELDRQYGTDGLVSMDLNNIGNLFTRKGEVLGSTMDFHRAVQAFSECLILARREKDLRTELRVLNNLGSVYTALNMQSKALQYLLKARIIAEKVSDSEALGMIHNNLGWVDLHRGNPDGAMDHFAVAVTEGERGFNSILWEGKWGLGQCLEKKGLLGKAAECYQQSIDTIEEVRNRIFLDTHKAGFIQHKRRVYEDLINLLLRIQKERPSRDGEKTLFRLVERAKATSFLDMMAASRTDVLSRLKEGDKAEEKQISLRISRMMTTLLRGNLPSKMRSELMRELGAAESRYMELLSRIWSVSPEVVEAVSPRLLSLEEIQKGYIDEKTALIEYFVGETRSLLFVITKNNVWMNSLPGREELETSLKAYLKMISNPPAYPFKGGRASIRLYRELLSPLDRKALPEIENLIIIPDSVLYRLPFETLTDPASSDKETQRMLIEEYTTVYAPSASSLLFLSAKEGRTVPKKEFLAFGNPLPPAPPAKKTKLSETDIQKDVYESLGFGFSPLRYGEKEVRRIARYFPRDKRDVYLEADAGENVIKNVENGSYRIIHFACHGFLDELYPARSALLLSRSADGSEDGFLQVREIYNLRLSADLVVLSGCQTGRERLAGGEGILGLPRIFFYAGAKAVVSSIWNIADRATAEFMDHFYSFMSQGMEQARALRMAKLNMIKSSYSHPFFWAGFVLYGDSSSLD